MTTGHLSYFWAPWCTRCAAVSPVVTSVAEANDVRVEMIDVAEQPDEAHSRKVFGVPTIIATAPDGNTYRRSGPLSETELQQLVSFAKGEKAARPVLDSDQILRLASGAALLAIGALTSTIGLTLLGVGLALSSVANRLRRNRDPAQ